MATYFSCIFKSISGSQERNAYAMSVWRRVKFKLEGRDPDPGIRSSEEQQVKINYKLLVDPYNILM